MEREYSYMHNGLSSYYCYSFLSYLNYLISIFIILYYVLQLCISYGGTYYYDGYDYVYDDSIYICNRFYLLGYIFCCYCLYGILYHVCHLLSCDGIYFKVNGVKYCVDLLSYSYLFASFCGMSSRYLDGCVMYLDNINASSILYRNRLFFVIQFIILCMSICYVYYFRM